jgi:hypothetical protein
MAERRTIDNWGAHLNIEGEELTIEQAMLLSLGHLNAREEIQIGHLSDMRMRMRRLERFIARMFPDYDKFVAEMLREEEEQRRAEEEARTGQKALRGA